MYPRGSPDIGWDDLLFGLAACVVPGAPWGNRATEAAFGPHSVACLSVRSGFDLTLQGLQLPRGGEVLVSAATIPDMIAILQQHGLQAIPLDLDMQRLALDPALVEAAITPRTCGLLVAHVFGARMPLDALADLARRYKLVLFEDAAQAFSGDGYCGHQGSDVAMFSFGPIKTATALGGGVLRFRDPTLLARVRALQDAYPPQRRSEYLRRLLLFCGLKALARPALLGPLVAWCRLRGRDVDTVLSGAVRGFRGSDLLAKIRRQPSGPLLRMLARRLRRYDADNLVRRAGYGRQILDGLPAAARPGIQAEPHTHWVLPVCSPDPERLTKLLRAWGYDATRSGSTMRVTPPPDGYPAATEAQQVFDQIVYVPTYPILPPAAAARLTAIITAHLRD
ncbi:MAG: DegT/DnrJ/EryC1/StrS aminotransferase family protein [Oscillochloris sp.]|nr:DegT/DnrJ/EryC1/StrS aminotransferase family protein [Oscillochloris sp.]